MWGIAQRKESSLKSCTAEIQHAILNRLFYCAIRYAKIGIICFLCNGLAPPADAGRMAGAAGRSAAGAIRSSTGKKRVISAYWEAYDRRAG